MATKSVDFPEHYIANIPWGQGVGHPPVEVYYHFVVVATGGPEVGGARNDSFASNSIETLTIAFAFVAL